MFESTFHCVCVSMICIQGVQSKNRARHDACHSKLFKGDCSGIIKMILEAAEKGRILSSAKNN